ncbi:hypothetical protein B0H14DRAFT_1293531 [Mycena olivaceomarginata]|nr:hypothetical protein B0H14DRAFT_1293531 [Mycena olivaceomarginata]
MCSLCFMPCRHVYRRVEATSTCAPRSIVHHPGTRRCDPLNVPAPLLSHPERNSLDAGDLRPHTRIGCPATHARGCAVRRNGGIPFVDLPDACRAQHIFISNGGRRLSIPLATRRRRSCLCLRWSVPCPPSLSDFDSHPSIHYSLAELAGVPPPSPHHRPTSKFLPRSHSATRGIHFTARSGSRASEFERRADGSRVPERDSGDTKDNWDGGRVCEREVRIHCEMTRALRARLWHCRAGCPLRSSVLEQHTTLLVPGAAAASLCPGLDAMSRRARDILISIFGTVAACDTLLPSFAYRRTAIPLPSSVRKIRMTGKRVELRMRVGITTARQARLRIDIA